MALVAVPEIRKVGMLADATDSSPVPLAAESWIKGRSVSWIPSRKFPNDPVLGVENWTR